jgi:hypothetical protein
VKSFGPFAQLRRAAVRAISMLLFFLTVTSVMRAQQEDSTVEWKVTVKDLDQRLSSLSTGDAGAVASWRYDAEGLRTSLATFATAHPEVQFNVPDPLPENPSQTQMKEQLDKLSAAVDDVIQQSPGSPFHLGTENVVVSADDSTPALVADNLDQNAIQQHDFTNIAKAFDYLPGVEIEHIAPRNEAGIRVRGFTTRGQVPFYIDGIPVSVPYDGYVDFNRFLTSDIAELQVTKGFSSPLLGPNSLGGTINVVTKEPIKKFEGEALDRYRHRKHAALFAAPGNAMGALLCPGID